MFTLEIIKDTDPDYPECFDIKLHYDDGDFTVDFEPEQSDLIKYVDLEKDEELASGGANGEFSLSWDGPKILFVSASYGSGNKGRKVTGMNKTPERMASLMSCLKEWKALF